MLPEDVGGGEYRMYSSGGDEKRRGVGMIVTEEVAKSVMICEPISDRIMVMRLKVTPVNVLVVQVYAPCDVEGSIEKNEEEKDRFYERHDQVIGEYRKGRDCLVVMGDFNGNVGEGREEDTVGPFG